MQYATEVLIVVGLAYIIKKWRKMLISPVFLAFALASGVILCATIITPSIAAIINATRLYHITLFFLAPTLILGGKLIFRNLKVLTLCLLIPYFLFTSGLVCELTGYIDISNADIPYSVALSNHRVDLGGSLTHSDKVARDWAVDNERYPIYADWYGLLFLHERMGVGAGDLDMLPTDLSDLPDNCYIFLRERNAAEKSVILWSGIGLREQYGYGELGLIDANLHRVFSNNHSGIYLWEGT